MSQGWWWRLRSSNRGKASDKKSKYCVPLTNLLLPHFKPLLDLSTATFIISLVHGADGQRGVGSRECLNS